MWNLSIDLNGSKQAIILPVYGDPGIDVIVSGKPHIVSLV